MSASSDDIKKSYMLGASSYFVKPPEFDPFERLLKLLHELWLLAEVPAVDARGRHLNTNSAGKLGKRFPQNLGASNDESIEGEETEMSSSIARPRQASLHSAKPKDDAASQQMVHRCIQLLARYAIRLDQELSAANTPHGTGSIALTMLRDDHHLSRDIAGKREIPSPRPLVSFAAFPADTQRQHRMMISARAHAPILSPAHRHLFGFHAY